MLDTMSYKRRVPPVHLSTCNFTPYMSRAKSLHFLYLNCRALGKLIVSHTVHSQQITIVDCSFLPRLPSVEDSNHFEQRHYHHKLFTQVSNSLANIILFSKSQPLCLQTVCVITECQVMTRHNVCSDYYIL